MFNKVEINISESCNLKCDFCPRANGYPNKKDYMSLETAEMIAASVVALNHKPTLVISGRGEPTMHPQFDELVDIFLKNDITVNLYTNGYNFEKYEDTIRKIHYVYCDVYTNEQDYYKAIEDVVDFPNNVLVYFKTQDGVIKSKYKDSNLIKTNVRFVANRAGYVSDRFNNHNFKNSCKYLDDDVYINWNGDYNLCCHDWGPTVLGNIKDQTINYYYNNNTKLKQFRDGIKNNKRLFPCDRCDV